MRTRSRGKTNQLMPTRKTSTTNLVAFASVLPMPSSLPHPSRNKVVAKGAAEQQFLGDCPKRDEPQQHVVHRHQRRGHSDHGVAGKRIHKQASGDRISHPARLQIEQAVRIKLADRRTVRAAHIIGEDLELRLAVGPSIVREQKMLMLSP